MKYEKLNNGTNNKKVFLYGFITCAILLIIFNFFVSFAKYKSVDSVKLASGTINYESADLNVIAMYKNDGEGTEDIPIEKIPETGYTLDDTKSYCAIGSNIDNKIKDIFEYKENKISITIDTKGTKCYFYFKKNPTAEDTLANLFKGYTTQDSGTNFSTGSNGVLKVTGIDTGNHEKTLYKAEDNDGASYFFRGQAPDNWVQFAGMRWRIIRINGDGTIRMIFQCSETDCKDTTGTGTNAGTSEYKTKPVVDNTYVGYYNFGKESGSYNEAHTGTTPSTIAAYLNQWYGTNLAKYDGYIDSDAGFCNDRQKVTGVKSDYDSGTGYGTSATTYAAYGRVEKDSKNRTEQLPTLKCGVSANTTVAQETSVAVDEKAYQRDLFTKEGAKKGNGILPHPIGLITADEILLAGGYHETGNSSYYLYTNQAYWTMSPYYVYTSGAAFVFVMVSGGFINGNGLNYANIGVRPVINLKANISFELGGEGTIDSPFVVVTN